MPAACTSSAARVLLRVQWPWSSAHSLCRDAKSDDAQHVHSQSGLRPQDWAGIWRMILARWGAPLEAAAEAHQHGVETEASASEGHALDLQLRRMLADALADIDNKGGKARAAQILNARRKQLLQRQGTDFGPLSPIPTAT